jgi:hypothetical protein
MEIRGLIRNDGQQSDISDRYVAYMIALIFPVRAITKPNKKDINGLPEHSRLIEIIGVNEADLFKNCFENNSKKTMRQFFSHAFIKHIWHMIEVGLTYDDCFGRAGPRMSIWITYKKISQKLKMNFDLEMPEWWNTLFNS